MTTEDLYELPTPTDDDTLRTIKEIAQLIVPDPDDSALVAGANKARRGIIKELTTRAATLNDADGDGDVLLDLIAQTAHERDEAEKRVRLLLAYANTASPRAYLNTELATAAHLTPSGARTAWTRQHVETILKRLPLDDVREARTRAAKLPARRRHSENAGD